MFPKISKIKTALAISSLLVFYIPMMVSAQTPPPGTLNITTTTTDDINITPPGPGPSYVFWYLISGYPSPSNPWLAVSTENGTGTGTTKLAEGSYGIYQQSDYQDWKIATLSCASGGNANGDPLPNLGIASVSITTNAETTCTFSNKYIATGNLNIIVKTDGGSDNFIFTLQHTGTEDRKVTVGTKDAIGEKVTELHADVPSGTGSSNFLNSYTIKVGEITSSGSSILPPGWVLDDATCQRQDASQVGTFDGTSAIFPVPVEPHKTTTCTFRVHQKVGTIEIYNNISASESKIEELRGSVPGKKPTFIYQMGGLLASSTGDLSIGAAGSFYYPLPYYIQLKVNKFPDKDASTSPRHISTTQVPWGWGKETVSVNPGIYYIQQTSDDWSPSSITCVQVYQAGEDLVASGSPAPSTPSSGDRVFIDEKNNWVNKCAPGVSTNCCSIVVSKLYKDINNPPPPPITGKACSNDSCVNDSAGTSSCTVGDPCTPPPAPPATAPPYLNYGNPEKCVFGTTNPINRQFNLTLSNSSIASVPVAPGGKTICVFSNSEKSIGNAGRGGGGGFNNPIKPTNPDVIE